MKLKPALLICTLLADVSLALPGQAVPMQDDDQDLMARSCAQLDSEISALIPGTYSTQPDFYDDPNSALVANIGLFVFEPAAHYLVYRESHKMGEQVKIQRYQDRVAQLRLAKARKRCFE